MFKVLCYTILLHIFLSKLECPSVQRLQVFCLVSCSFFGLQTWLVCISLDSLKCVVYFGTTFGQQLGIQSRINVEKSSLIVSNLTILHYLFLNTFFCFISPVVTTTIHRNSVEMTLLSFVYKIIGSQSLLQLPASAKSGLEQILKVH